MLKRLTTAATMVLLLSACGGGAPPEPPPPPPFSPAGTYDISIDAQGMMLGGVLIIEGSPEAGWTGSIETEMGGTGLSEVVVNGMTVTFALAEIGGQVELQFDGDEFSGGMTSAMGDAGISGVKRTGG